MRIVVMALTLAACAPSAAQAPDADWIAGSWLSCDGGVQTAEAWIGAGSGVMAGVNHTRQADGGVRFEHMRIAPGENGVLTFFASPSGAAPTPFAATAVERERIVFENAAHDFPQRVIYARDGEVLTARIEGVIGGEAQAMDWRFTPAEIGATCPRAKGPVP